MSYAPAMLYTPSSSGAPPRTSVDARSRGLTASQDEIVFAVEAALAERRPVHDPFEHPVVWTVAERGALEQGGGDDRALPLGARDPALVATADYAAIVTSALSTAQVAKLLKVTTGRVCQRLQGRSLLGVSTRRGWRIPSFQFVASGELPGWAEITRALPATVTVTGVMRWLLEPHPDLVVGDDEVPVSPREWLLSGQDPAAVVALTADFEHP